MQILRLTLENLRAIDSVELDLSTADGRPRRRTVILAANGFGKTTTLDAIAHIYGQFDERLGARSVTAADLRRTSTPQPGPGEVSPTGLVEIEANLVFEERQSIRAYFPDVPEHGPLRREIGSMPARDRSFTAQALLDSLASSESVRDDTFTAPVRAALLESRGAPCVYLVADRGTLAAPADVSAPELADFDPKVDCLAPGRARFRTLAARLALAYVSPRDNDRDGLVKRLWAVLAQYLPNMPRPVGVRGLTLLFDNQRRAQVGLSELSDGERAVLLLLGEIALRNPEHGVVLIDELEQHLHPRWQRDILDALVALAPTAQFIITTQSVSLAASAEDDLVKIGDWDEYGA
ncbi:MAG TPA: AAA family ATPase [Polyangia bacterium]|jgi:ABC-type branched-subunit amino acid transport system ATPase component|nr:AAA family ATPase [Polyangia bacterium]